MLASWMQLSGGLIDESILADYLRSFLAKAAILHESPFLMHVISRLFGARTGRFRPVFGPIYM